MAIPNRLRVALLAGCLSRGGAEKQLVYMARALRDAGVHVQVYSLTRNQFYEKVLTEAGLPPIWVGRYSQPLARLAAVSRATRRFRPHIVQSTHFFTNLYTAISARMCGAVAIGSVRNDVHRELKATGRWGPWLLRTPPAVLSNSHVGHENAEASGVKKEANFMLPNVIDLDEFNMRALSPTAPVADESEIVAMAVGRLVRAKRIERFLCALSRSRIHMPLLKGIVVGDGPAKPYLESTAADLGLLPNGVQFLGMRDDVPSLLKQAALLVVSSDHEGASNVILEAMAARVPVVTTPAGDARYLVQDYVNGFVVPFDGEHEMSKRMSILAESPELRCRFGEAGRRRVEQDFAYADLADRLLDRYRRIAHQQSNHRAIRVLSTDTAAATDRTLAPT